MTLRILHVVPSYWPAVRYGGPVVSVRQLCASLARRGVSVDVATTNADGGSDLGVPLDTWVPLDGCRVRYFRRWPRVDYAFSPDLLAYLRTVAGRYDLLHITSTFSFPSLAAGWAARSAGLPYVVSPRGSLQGWALRHKRWKKLPYWWLLERRHLERAARIHATAEAELEQIMQVLPKARVFIAPNGVEFPSDPGVTRYRRRIAFLGRIHPVKGFDVLLPALSQLARSHPDVETVLAGPDDVGEWDRIQGRLRGLDPRPAVTWVGPVQGEAKWQFLAAAGLLVLPSHTENFGQVVVEAMACRTPVVVSRNCPWSLVAERGAGAWVDNSPDALAAALRSVLDASPAQYAGMQEAASALAAEFAWSTIAATMEREYAVALSEANSTRSRALGDP